jgi:hypothetical protein
MFILDIYKDKVCTSNTYLKGEEVNVKNWGSSEEMRRNNATSAFDN